MRTSDDEPGRSGPASSRGRRTFPRRCFALRWRPTASVVPDIRRKLPGRGVWTRLSFETVRRAAAKQAFSRAFRAKAEAPDSLAETVDALLERDALQFAVDRQQGGPRRRRRVQGRCGDRGRSSRRAHPGERRGGGRSGQARPRLAREPRAGGGSRCARRSLFFGSIGFGIGEDKCDTCCPQTWGGEFGLSRKGGSFAPLPRRGSGRGDPERARRRDGGQGAARSAGPINLAEKPSG